MIRKVFIEYRENGTLVNANSVELGSDDGLYGIKNVTTGSVVVPYGTTVDNPSPGLYEYTYDFSENSLFKVSWRIVPTDGGQARYATEEIGPFQDTNTVRAVSEFRGSFRQNTTATVFLRITEINGDARDAEEISVSITDSLGTEVVSGTPEKVTLGFYAFDWLIPFDEVPGEYFVNWQYTVDETDRVAVQRIVVSADATDTAAYSGRVVDFRASLSLMLAGVMAIPVYDEQAKQSADNKTFQFTFQNWNQSPGCRIYRNGNVVTGGVTIDFEKGQVTFDDTQTGFDVITADYNFRWFTDKELDRFLSNGVHMMNIFPPVTGRTLLNVEDIYIPIILYGAVVDALRFLMLSIKTQQNQLVFGGPEGAQKAFSDFESLKKNYEETWNKLLEQKKNGPYKGLTRMISTPPFALPGGRSRWFRYLFSSNTQ